MDCNENLETSLDDIYNYNVNTHGGNKKKRSSILKQTKKINIDIYENEETDCRRSRLSMKRVSFAEKFQVKELHTGNIYDIPGWNESSQQSQASIQLSYVTESDTNNFAGSFPSRSFVPDASVTFQEPTGSNRNQTSQNNKPQGDENSCKSDRNGFTIGPSLGKPNLENHFEKENLAPSSTSKTVIALLEGKPVAEDKEIMQYRDNANIYSEPYGRKEESMSITSSISHSSWMGEEFLKDKSNISDDFDFLRDSMFKSGSQEYKNGKENPSKLQVGVGSENPGLGKVAQKTTKGEVDILNKENAFQTSPRFKNLKFIDSPPSSYKSDQQNALKHQNNSFLGNKLVDNPVSGVAFLSKNKVVKSNVHQKAVGLPSEADKENAGYGAVQRAIREPPSSKFVSHAPLSSPCEEDNFPMNKTRCSVSAMDLTCLPEAFSEDADISCNAEHDAPVDLELSFEGDRIPLNRYAGDAIGKSGWVNEKTQNKTRLSTCDMEITCAFNSPMDDSSLSISPPRDDKWVDIGEPKTIEKDNLNHFEEAECALDLSPKSSQQSNFSFEEIEQSPPSSNSMDIVSIQPISDIDKLVNSSKPTKYCESTLMNPSFGNKELYSYDRITSSEIPEHNTLKKIGQNLNLCHATDVAPGRKYLKFSAESENAPDRLQTQSPGKESDTSFILKNKENLHTNRKRAVNSTNKPTRLPLGFRTDDLEVSSQPQNYGKSVTEMAGASKAGIVSSGESALAKEDVSVGDPCRPEIPGNNQMTRLYRSEIMELTCHDFGSEESEDIPTPVMKQVHILTETEIANPNVVISSRKYENTRYSTNFMELTCLPESEDSSNVLDSFQETGTKTPSFVSDEIELTCNFKNQSQHDTNYSINSSIFRRIEQLSETASSDGQTDKYSHWPLNFENSSTATLKKDKNTQYFTSEAMELTCKTTDFQGDRIIVEDNDENESNQLLLHSKCLGDKTLTKFENKTQYFASQPMEMTTIYQDDSLLAATPKSDNSASEEHHVPPYFHLKELPVSDSTNKNSLNCSTNRSVRARQKMFKVVTDDFSSSKPSSSPKRSETVENPVSHDKSVSVSSVLPSNPMDKNCLNAEIASSVPAMDSCFRVNTTHKIVQKVAEEIVSEKSCPEVVDKNSASADLKMVKNHPPSRTPGAVYKIRKIRKAFKESNGNLVLFPELSEALRKQQKFSFKQPYSEMKITSPEVKDWRQNRSFEPSSQENSFSCSSGEGSRLPSLGQLSSHFKDSSEDADMPVVPVSTEVGSLCQEIENLNVLVTSHQSPNMSKVYRSEASEKNRSPNVSKVDYSMVSPEKLRCQNVSKADHFISYNQVPSIMDDDDSLQLLQHSALENTYLEAASKQYTICLDRSDFVLREKCLISTDEQPQLLPPNISLQNSNESDIECNYTISQADSISQKRPMSPYKLKVDEKSTSNADEASLGSKISLTFPEINKSILAKETYSLATNFPQHKPSMNDSSAARLRENECSFPKSLTSNDALKSSPMNKTRMLFSLEQSKSSMDISLEKTNETCLIEAPTQTDGNNDKSFNTQDANRVIGEELTKTANNVTELFNVQEDLRIVSDTKRTLGASNAVEKTLTALKGMDSLNIQKVDTAGNDAMDIDSQAGVPSTEKQNNLASSTCISKTALKKLQNSEVTNSSDCPDNYSQDFVEEKPNEKIKSVNEEVIRNRVVEHKDCVKSSVGDLSNSRIPVLKNNLNYFEEQLEKAFASEGHKFKLKNLCASAATLELTWAVFVYKCVLQIDVKRIGASESSVSFTPVGENVGSSAADNVFADIQERGYKMFQYLVTDTLLPFPVFSKELIDKLTEYSRVASNVETLMRDLLKVAFASECVIPHELDPLKFTVRAINTNYECIYNMTFCVDLKKYPREKIIPEVKHVLCKDITEEVRIAAASVEPGLNYLYRMLDAALELKP